MSKIRRTFVFHPVRDQDILAALDALADGKKSRVVRAALRCYFEQQANEPTLTEIVARLKSLQETVERLQVGSWQPVETDNDDEFTNALLDLGS